MAAAASTTDDAGPALKKPKKKGDSRVLEALTDVRLKGSQQAVYFTLRGFGMDAIEGPGQVPRIEVFAAKQPGLFAALRRLGLRNDGKRIIVEARDDEPAFYRPAAASQGASHAKKPHLQERSEISGTRSMGLSRSTPALSAAEHAEFFEKMSWPKVFGNKASYMASLSEAAVELLRSSGSRESATSQAAVPGAAGSTHSKRGSLAESESHTVTPSRKEGDATPKTASSSTSALPPLRLSRPRRELHEQREYCSKMSKPIPRLVRPKVDNTFRYEREQSRTGLAAERSFLSRLAELRRAQQQKEEEKAFSEHEAFLHSMQKERGAYPPDPSLASESKRPSLASMLEGRVGELAAAEEQSRGTEERSRGTQATSSHVSSNREANSTLGLEAEAV
eukprot:TRINITY_DN48340_c0_g1_i1.p1 TRINITY_DN48340_c0_g1~~TRINITY_DN48340_c0_g1_i1.p1  ORF type:complete len:393 (+),score=85.73 TRINITY_DN48340_c0_g1_i1:83-1261(+)